MSDPDLTNLLKWGVENSDSSRKDPTSQIKNRQNLNTEALAALLGNQRSNAQLMQEAMEIIKDEKKDLKNRLVAFDNFEQLIEGIDNANNLGPLELWEPLVKMLRDKEAELRTYAASCCATAVQNNIKSQERLLILGAIPTIVKLATEDSDPDVRKKAILALSSATRNYQPGLDATLASLPEEHKVNEKLDAADMDSVNILIQKLRDNSKRLG